MRSAVIEAAAADGTARGEGRLLGLTGYAAAVLLQRSGSIRRGLRGSAETCEYEDLGFYGWCLFELIEAAARTGDQEAVALAVQRFDSHGRARAEPTGAWAPWQVRAPCWPTTTRAEGLFIEAIERFDAHQGRVHPRRTRLSYGEWLRRVNRRVDARQQLNTAHEMFTRMGAQGFAERARRELVATGEKVRKQQVSSGDELTAQEAQIARLAADGLTNQEIGAQLFISTHTVEWHLRKVFVKLGITSRRQLRTVSWAS